MTFPLELQFVDLNALVSFCTPATQQRKARTIHIVLQWKRDGDKRSPLAVAVEACQSSTWMQEPAPEVLTMPLHWRDWVKDQHLAGREAGWWRFGERVGHGGWLIGPKLFRPKAYLTWVSSRLCKFIFRLMFKPLLPLKNIAWVCSLRHFVFVFSIIMIANVICFSKLSTSFCICFCLCIHLLTPRPKLGIAQFVREKFGAPFTDPRDPAPLSLPKSRRKESNFFPHQYI